MVQTRESYGDGDNRNTAVTRGDKASKCLIIYHGSHGKGGNICGNTAELGSNGVVLQQFRLAILPRNDPVCINPTVLPKTSSI